MHMEPVNSQPPISNTLSDDGPTPASLGQAVVSANAGRTPSTRQAPPGTFSFGSSEAKDQKGAIERLARVLIFNHADTAGSDVRPFSLHNLRRTTREAALPYVFEQAESLDAFLRRLAYEPDVAVCRLAQLPTPDAQLIADHAGRAGVLLLVVGCGSDEERAALHALAPVTVRCVREGQLQWLPIYIERAILEQRLAADRDRAGEELKSAAQMMSETQKLVTIGRLAGSIAHEINNPLESVTNLLYLMATDTGVPEHVRQYLDLAQQELARVAQITKQTLNFYRETQTPVRIEVPALLEEVLVLYERRIAEKKVSIVRDYSNHDESMVVFPGELRQVFANLIANALEATGDYGRLVLRVSGRRKWNEPSVRGLRILIADSGSGIPAEARQKLGQPFFTTKGQRGTGLGLWVTQAIIKRYGGTLQLRSSTAPLRHGTTFSIFLPIHFGPQVVVFPGLSGSDPARGAGQNPMGESASGQVGAAEASGMPSGTHSGMHPKAEFLREGGRDSAIRGIDAGSVATLQFSAR